MELESTNSGPTAKLPILKLENGDSWVSVPQTTQENGTSVTKMSIPVTAEEKTNKKNDVKARGLLLMPLPNEHQLTSSQYPDAKSMFSSIETRFRGNAATKKTLLKQQYENFSASSAESLDSIFNRLKKIVSRLSILGVIISQEDLNLKFLSSLPPEWNTHVVVWMNKPEVETMSIDDLYNNFKIVEQKVKKTVGTSSGGQNLAFMTAPSTSSTNDANTACPQVSAASPSVNTTSPQLHCKMSLIILNDLKWQLSLLVLRAKKYIRGQAEDFPLMVMILLEYDKSKVECYKTCHKLGHLCRKCRAQEVREVSSEIKSTPSSKERMKTLQRHCYLLGDFWAHATTNDKGLLIVDSQAQELAIFRMNPMLGIDDLVYYFKNKDATQRLLNRVLVVKPHNKNTYELFRGKFVGKSDEVSLWDIYLSSKAFRIYNTRKRVDETWHIGNSSNDSAVSTAKSIESTVQTRRMLKPTSEQGFLSDVLSDSSLGVRSNARKNCLEIQTSTSLDAGDLHNGKLAHWKLMGLQKQESKRANCVRSKFAETHNVVAFLEKLVESDGFAEIIDFLKASSVKAVNGVRQFQALIDKKKVIITEASIRNDLHLDVAEEEAKSDQAIEIASLKKRVDKLEKRR
ncbi:hypothetical protein Tco_0908524 [Tanacetum coccineum]|uniref:Uncharacterized protein n=1 Tax=Tanacetum coccineum TaxID=301880 RepID=A0ABQ5CNG4_9ASTR